MNIFVPSFFTFRCGLSRLECIVELKFGFGDKAPSSYSTVKNWFNEFNWGRPLKDDIREGAAKTAVVSEYIDVVRWLVMQVHHVTYREIKTSLGISSTSMHSSTSMRPSKRFVLVGYRTIARKKFRVDWCNEMLKKYNGGASKDVYKIVTGDESRIFACGPATKQQSTVWVFEPKPNLTKVVCGKNHVKANGGLFLLQNWSCGDYSNWPLYKVEFKSCRTL